VNRCLKSIAGGRAIRTADLAGGSELRRGDGEWLGVEEAGSMVREAVVRMELTSQERCR
jgi:hypothetical protein